MPCRPITAFMVIAWTLNFDHILYLAYCTCCRSHADWNTLTAAAVCPLVISARTSIRVEMCFVSAAYLLQEHEGRTTIQFIAIPSMQGGWNLTWTVCNFYSFKNSFSGAFDFTMHSNFGPGRLWQVLLYTEFRSTTLLLTQSSRELIAKKSPMFLGTPAEALPTAVKFMYIAPQTPSLSNC